MLLCCCFRLIGLPYVEVLAQLTQLAGAPNSVAAVHVASLCASRELQGLLQKLAAFDRLLTSRPELRSKLVLIQVTTPPLIAAIADTSDKLQWSLLEAVGRTCGAHSMLTGEAGAPSGGPVYYFTTR